MRDAFELNKIAGAVLFSFLVILGIGIVADTIFHVEQPRTPGYAIEVAEQPASGGEAAPAEAEVPLAQLLANASAEKGQSAARKCTSCHTFEEGGPNRVGPNLHGVVGRPAASVEGFAYSNAMQAHDGTWTYEELFKFLQSPRNYIPGTAMAFAGIRNSEELADLLLYLRSISPDAPPLPEPEAQQEAEPQPEQDGQAEPEAEAQTEQQQSQPEPQPEPGSQPQ